MAVIELSHLAVRHMLGKGHEIKNELIGYDPSILMGKPAVARTRISIEQIIEALAAGESHEQILNAYPRLTEVAILAALSFSAGKQPGANFREEIPGADDPI